VEAGVVCILHLLHTAATWGQVQRLLRDQRVIPFLDLADRAEQELTQLDLEVGLHLLQVRSRLNAADEVQPV
jgi:hypothetical protein